MTKRTAETKYFVYYSLKNSKTHVRLMRPTNMNRMIIRLTHMNIRNSQNALNDLLLYFEEFKEIFLAQDKGLALIEYRKKLDIKPYEKLGVNIE